jgi:hypothetical protein
MIVWCSTVELELEGKVPVANLFTGTEIAADFGLALLKGAVAVSKRP